MAEKSKIKEFPEISSKLTAPSKKSLFERQKAEAEAKREREKKETAAVYEDFVKSFDNDDDDDFASGAIGGPPKRHFGNSTGYGGRGGLGGPRGGLGGGRGASGPGSLGPVSSSLSKKRPFEELPQQRNSNQGLFNFKDAEPDVVDTKAAFRHSDDEEEESLRSKSYEKVAPKPAIHLSSLPPGTSQAVTKSIIPTTLQVEGVRILPPSGPSGPGSTERRSLSAIVTLAKDTPAIDIDTVVSALQNRYLGWGYYLSLSRHLSSAALGSLPAPYGLSSTSSLPFGAKPIPIEGGRGFTQAPPPGPHRGGFAPPSSYTTADSAQYGRNMAGVQVNVAPPADFKQLKLIHKMIEALLTHGPEFEALLMSRPEVQKEEKWAWLWDSRSPGGVWYRWRLWDILTGAKYRIRNGTSRNSSTNQEVFRGEAPWVAPERVIPYEYVTELEEFVSDSDYNSSDEDDSGDEGRRRYHHLQGGAPIPETMLGTDADGQSYLNPLQKAKLVHLLARLPTTTAKLRRGDIARVTAFAIQHASEGAEEVVDIITSNVKTPFSSTNANPDRRIDNEDVDIRDEDEPMDDNKKMEKEDTSSSKLIALYVISDILSSSSTSGVRHAWRYRQLFEATLRNKKVFEGLGRLERVMGWGRLRAEKWKRSVTTVLGLWEGWCVFSQASQEFFTHAFMEPPLTAKEEETNRMAEKAAAQAVMSKSKWKTVEKEAQHNEDMDVDKGGSNQQADVDAEGESFMDAKGLDDDTMGIDEDVDGQPMEDVDGEPMEDEDEDGDAMDVDAAFPQPSIESLEDTRNSLSGSNGAENMEPTIQKDVSPTAGRRRRPRAEDMFADSDSN